MDLRRRLARLEKLADAVRPDPDRCPACGAPVPSIPNMVYLGSDGSIRAGGIFEHTLLQCERCGGYGGLTALAIDPETGAHRGILIVLPATDEADGMNLDLGEWLAQHDVRELGRPWDEWIRLIAHSRN